MTETETAFAPDAPSLRVIPLGGLGEFGMNMMVYEYGESSIIVDCGMMFPDSATLGVDAVIPDMSYVFERAQNVVGIFLTHGHEDHIGAIPFLAEKVHAPIYGMPLTLAFIDGKFEEFGMKGMVDVRPLAHRTVVEAGPFRVEPIHVTHSIVDAIALAITTPAGTIIHTGDFKFDSSPIDHRPTDLSRFADLGEEGVALLLSDSTNAIIDGYSHSERTVGASLERIFANATGRIIVTTFASHIHRLQQIIDTARRYRRKVFLIGRSVVDNVEIAERLGWIRFPREVRPGHNKPMDEEAKDTVIITTGTQGEPTSALARMALGEHKFVTLAPGDLVIISARTIPGNEKAIGRVIDNLYRRGADVIHDEVRDIHVSGHACREELKTLLNLTRPRFFIPIHGGLRQLVHHAKLAESAGVRRDNIFVITNGEVVEMREGQAHILDQPVSIGKVFVDNQAEEVAEVVLRDRRHLAEDGFVIIVLALDMSSGRLVREPEIITRGLVHVDESADVLGEVRELLNSLFLETAIEELRDAEAVQERIRSALKRYFRKKLSRRPMILPVVWEM